MRDLAQRMHDLFLGCELGHGTYGSEERKPGRLKTEIKKSAKTLKGAATVDMWLEHLDGRRPLGVIPIRRNGSCYWGVIDVDIYQLSHRDIANKLSSLGLPMHVCRSKSGGAHLFIFMSEPVDAESLQMKLREIASVLGYGESEIFPKQTELLYERGDLGNWLNMPYFNMDKDTRYAVDKDGKGLSIERFLSIAEGSRLTAREFEDLRPKIPEVKGGDLDEGPPCLQTMAAIGVAEGGRNNAMFAYGVLAKKKFPDDWEAKLDEWNHKFFAPPLTSSEVTAVKNSLKKKDYSYKCKDQPLCNHCDAILCRTRKFGVGESLSPPLSSIRVLASDPPTFMVSTLDGKTIECTSEQLLNIKSFRVLHLEQTRRNFGNYKQDAWDSKVTILLQDAVEVEFTEHDGPLGAFKSILSDWLSDRSAAKTREEIKMGRPWLDEEAGVYYFNIHHLMQHLDQLKFRDFNRSQIIARLHEMGAVSKQLLIERGRNLRCWALSQDRVDVDTEPLSVPRVKDQPI